MTMKSPVGPPICTRLPPRAEMRKPATTAVYRPIAGGDTPAALATFSGMEAIPNAIAKGSRNNSDGDARQDIADQRFAVVASAKKDDRFRQVTRHRQRRVPWFCGTLAKSSCGVEGRICASAEQLPGLVGL